MRRTVLVVDRETGEVGQTPGHVGPERLAALAAVDVESGLVVASVIPPQGPHSLVGPGLCRPDDHRRARGDLAGQAARRRVFPRVGHRAAASSTTPRPADAATGEATGGEVITEHEVR